MIPAILSCIFVLYLYRTLNAPETDGMTSSDPAVGSSESELAARLDDLQRRLAHLVDAQSTEGTK
jgi:hypothetical protein